MPQTRRFAVNVTTPCDEVGLRDPLQLKVLLSTVHPWNGTVRYEHGQCTHSYSVR